MEEGDGEESGKRGGGYRGAETNAADVIPCGLSWIRSLLFPFLKIKVFFSFHPLIIFLSGRRRLTNPSSVSRPSLWCLPCSSLLPSPSIFSSSFSSSGEIKGPHSHSLDNLP